MAPGANTADILDASVDSVGSRLVTAWADGTLRICSARADAAPLASLKANKGKVLSVAWGSLRGERIPRLLASGAADGQVTVWRENSVSGGSSWNLGHEVYVTGAAAAVAFSPPVEGSAAGGGAAGGPVPLLLAVAGADSLGVVTMLARRETSPVNPAASEQWVQAASFPAHPGGVSALGWAPNSSPVALASGPAVARGNSAPLLRRLATGGADGAVRIWHSDRKSAMWTEKYQLADESHSGAIRDLAWRPNPGIPTSILATCTAEGSVAMWQQDTEGQPWFLQACWKVGGDARRLAWSLEGTLLAVSVGDDGSLLYREAAGGQWEQVAELAGDDSSCGPEGHR
mmetsp:Transcript_61404/g.171675  ORF Transcript_61404/g.171675 Transcript_61404/m.171675 type:complete len:344 (-) Transcript_61404:87-1118(-)